jgi:hypothetical protein
MSRSPRMKVRPPTSGIYIVSKYPGASNVTRGLLGYPMANRSTCPRPASRRRTNAGSLNTSSSGRSGLVYLDVSAYQVNLVSALGIGRLQPRVSMAAFAPFRVSVGSASSEQGFVRRRSRQSADGAMAERQMARFSSSGG